MRFFFKIHLFSRDFFWWFICFHMIHFDMWWLHDSFILTWFFFKIHFILMWFSFKIHLFSPDFNMQFLYSQLIYFHVIFFHTLIIYRTWLTDFDVIFSPTWLIFSHDFWNDSFIFHMILSHRSFIWNVSFVFHMIHYFIELINHLFSNYSFPPCYFKPCVSGHVLLTRITHVITCDVECVWLFRKRRDVEEIQEQLRGHERGFLLLMITKERL